MSLKKTVILGFIKLKLQQPSSAIGIAALIYTACRFFNIDISEEYKPHIITFVTGVIGVLLIKLRESGEADAVETLKEQAVSSAIIDMANDVVQRQRDLQAHSNSEGGESKHGGFNG